MAALFKKCSSCRRKVSPTDGHDLCLFCLGEEHIVEKCSVCRSFTSQALKNRKARLASFLWERSLQSVSFPSHPDPLSTVPLTKPIPKISMASPVTSPSSLPLQSPSVPSGLPVKPKAKKKRPPTSVPTASVSKKDPKKIKKKSVVEPLTPPPSAPPPATAAAPSPSLAPLATTLALVPPSAPLLPQSLPISAPLVTIADSPPSVPTSSISMSLNTVEHLPDVATLPVAADPTTTADVAVPPAAPVARMGSDSPRRLRMSPAPPLPRSPTRRYDFDRYRAVEREGDRHRYYRDDSPFTSVSYMERYHHDYRWKEHPGSYRSYSPSYRDRYHASYIPSSPPHHYRRSRSPSYSRRSRSREPHRRRSRSRSRSRSRHRGPPSPPPRTTATLSRPPPSPPLVASAPAPTSLSQAITAPIPAAPLPVSSIFSTAPARPLPVSVAPSVPSVPVSVPTQPTPSFPTAPSPVHSTEPHKSPSSDGYESDSSSSPASPSPLTASPPSGIEDASDPLPLEDVRLFSDIVQRMATSIGLPVVVAPSKAKDCVFQLVHRQTAPQVSVPFLETLQDVLKQSWDKPSSLPPTSKRLENLYKTSHDSAPYLFIHPTPNSAIVEASQSKGQGKLHSAPPDKEGRRLDIFGRRFYSTASLAAKISNIQACMGAYQRFLWDKVLPLAPLLPDEQQRALINFHQEAVALSSQQIVSARHTADCASKSMSAAVSLRRYAWLRSTGIPEDTRKKIQDLPFDGVGLFNTGTDDALGTIDKARLTARRMGFTSQQPQHRQFRFQGRRQFPSFRRRSPVQHRSSSSSFPPRNRRPQRFQGQRFQPSSSKKRGDTSKQRL